MFIENSVVLLMGMVIAFEILKVFMWNKKIMGPMAYMFAGFTVIMSCILILVEKDTAAAVYPIMGIVATGPYLYAKERVERYSLEACSFALPVLFIIAIIEVVRERKAEKRIQERA